MPTMPPPRPPESSQHEVHVQGNGWRVTLPPVVVTALLTALGVTLGSKAVQEPPSAQATQVAEATRQDIAEFKAEFRAMDRELRKLGAQQAATEQAVNDIRSELIQLRRELRAR